MVSRRILSVHLHSRTRLLYNIIAFMLWELLLNSKDLIFFRYGSSSPIAVRSVSTAWNTCEHLQTFATVVFLAPQWRKQASALAVVRTPRDGAPWSKGIAPDRYMLRYCWYVARPRPVNVWLAEKQVNVNVCM
jgi:hypothetical protein